MQRHPAFDWKLLAARPRRIVDAQAQRANHLDRPSVELAFVFVAMKLKHVEAEFSPAFLDIVAAGIDENANHDRAAPAIAPHSSRARSIERQRGLGA